MNGGFREFVEEVRRRNDIVQVVGAEVDLRQNGTGLKGLSPFNPETNPSFVVWPESQRWRDYSKGGGRGGDVFDYVMDRKACTFKEALDELAGRVGVKRPNQDDAEYARELALITERVEIERLFTRAAAYYHRVLPSKIREELYHQHYGFKDETIDTLQLGWADGHLYDYLHDRFGVRRTEALKTGLFTRTPRGNVQDFFQNRLVFPYWRGGRVVYFIARSTQYTADKPWEQGKYKKALTHSEKHSYVSASVRNDFFYNEDASHGAKELLVTEGVTDCISAIQMGIPCISPVTTRFRDRDVPKLLALTRTSERIIVCNDAEASGAGEAGALNTAVALHADNRDVRIAMLPRPDGVAKVDVNEFLKEHSAEEFRSVLAQATPYVQFLIDRIPTDAPERELKVKIEQVLAVVVVSHPLERDRYLAEISRRFDVKLPTLKEMMKRLPKRTGEPKEARRSKSRPQIVLSDRPFHEVRAEAWSAIHAANKPPKLFRRSGALVRIARDEDGTRIATLDEASVFDVLGDVADWVHITREADPSGAITQLAKFGGYTVQAGLVFSHPLGRRGARGQAEAARESLRKAHLIEIEIVGQRQNCACSC
ncbi:MAG: CHC2 zinc finger domain-containing protein [Myxococcaceae bacterium]